MAISYILGRDAVAYYDASDNTLFTSSVGDTEADTWLGTATAVSNIMDLQLELDSEFVDATTRGEASQGFSSEIAVIKNGRVTFDIRWQAGDTFTTALLSHWTNGTEFAMAFMDQAYATASTTVSGLVANWSVSLSKSESLKDIQKASVTLSIASWPFWYDVTNGA